MVGIKGLGGIPEPKSDRPARIRDEKAQEATKAEKAQDDVLISNEAQAAASIAQVIQQTESIPNVRADRVAAAKESIERGDYKKPEVVAQVAERISKYLP